MPHNYLTDKCSETQHKIYEMSKQRWIAMLRHIVIHVCLYRVTGFECFSFFILCEAITRMRFQCVAEGIDCE